MPLCLAGDINGQENKIDISPDAIIDPTAVIEYHNNIMQNMNDITINHIVKKYNEHHAWDSLLNEDDYAFYCNSKILLEDDSGGWLKENMPESVNKYRLVVMTFIVRDIVREMITKKTIIVN